MAQADLRVVKTLRQIDHSLLERLADTLFEKITVCLLYTSDTFPF